MFRSAFITIELLIKKKKEKKAIKPTATKEISERRGSRRKRFCHRMV